MTSTMKATIGFVMLLFSTATTDIAGECDMAGFYLELGCKPAPSSDKASPCPEAFQCPDLHPDPTMCYYSPVVVQSNSQHWVADLSNASEVSNNSFIGFDNDTIEEGGEMYLRNGSRDCKAGLLVGVPYGDRTMLAQGLINNPCSQACSCRVSKEPRFDCAAVDCVETFDDDMQQQCINTYELDSCCSVGTVCGKDEIAKLKTCEIDGKTYREGESFEPLKTRKTCICTAKWNGSTDNPEYCRDINCGIEIHYQGNILDKCAPVFATGLRSCPISFECPSPTTKVVRGINLRSVSSQCVFGNMTLRVGDEVTVEEESIKCTCDVPPFVSCNRKNIG